MVTVVTPAQEEKITTRQSERPTRKRDPGTHGRFPPEQQQLLRRPHLLLIDRHPRILQSVAHPFFLPPDTVRLALAIRVVVVGLHLLVLFGSGRRSARGGRVVDPGLEEDEGDRGDDGPSGFEGSVTPVVVPCETPVGVARSRDRDRY